MKKVLVTGAGGFIGGHLVSKLIKKKYKVICADIKPIKNWLQVYNKAKNYSYDLKNFNECLKLTKKVDYVFNLACNMGGMGFIENNKAECMLSVLINTNLLNASRINKVKRYFFSSSACVYNANKQKKTFIRALKEKDAYPAEPEDGYGWEKLFSERMCRHFKEDFNLDVRIVRLHNVYGPFGTYDGERRLQLQFVEKFQQRKFSRKNKSQYGEMESKQEVLCTLMIVLMEFSKFFLVIFSEPINLGSSEQVSINQLIKIIEKYLIIKSKKYLLNKPKGVRGRSSDNTLIKKVVGWEPKLN